MTDATSDEQRQWEIDHPGGAISDEEEEAMAQYAFEACREEGHTARAERVLIYGSRTWSDPALIIAFVATLPADAVVVTGGASGADHLGELAARARGLRIEIHRANWQKHGRAAGPIRNQEMLDAGLSRARGFRCPGESRGTDDMTRRLVAAGIPHDVIGARAERIALGKAG